MKYKRKSRKQRGGSNISKEDFMRVINALSNKGKPSQEYFRAFFNEANDSDFEQWQKMAQTVCNKLPTKIGGTRKSVKSRRKRRRTRKKRGGQWVEGLLFAATAFGLLKASSSLGEEMPQGGGKRKRRQKGGGQLKKNLEIVLNTMETVGGEETANIISFVKEEMNSTNETEIQIATQKFLHNYRTNQTGGGSRRKTRSKRRRTRRKRGGATWGEVLAACCCYLWLIGVPRAWARDYLARRREQQHRRRRARERDQQERDRARREYMLHISRDRQYNPRDDPQSGVNEPRSWGR